MQTANYPVTLDFLVQAWADSCHWFKRAAAEMVVRRRYRVIYEDGKPYMFRAWLAGWREQPYDPVRPDLPREPDTSNASLLHCFIRPDHDRALHDHPWDFDTELLLGGYTEALPPLSWKPGSLHGPPSQARFSAWCAPDRISHAAGDLHAIIKTEPDTWTLVTTHQKVRPWGFHPPGELWVPAKSYRPSDNADFLKDIE